jgi:hypothetical protein
LDAIDDIIQETFPSHSDAPTPNDINNAPGGNSPSVRDQTETFPTRSDPSLDPNNINNPGIPPFVPPDTAHRDPVTPPVTHLETDLSPRIEEGKQGKHIPGHNN